MTITTAMHEIENWTVDDQLELVGLIWDKITDSGWQPTITDEQKAEFDRRIAAHDADPTKVSSWEDVVKYGRRPRELPQVP